MDRIDAAVARDKSAALHRQFGGTDQRQATASENRWAPRRRTALPAYVRVEGSQASQLAHVRDSSSSGLRIELPGSGAAARVPNRFELYIPIENTVLLCEIVWREDNQVGVRFFAPAKPLGMLPKARRAAVPVKTSLWGGLLGRKRN